MGSLGASGLLAVDVHAQGKPQPRREIELSETNSAEILTNLNLLNTKRDGLQRLEEQLRSVKGISSESSMESRVTLPYVAPTMSSLPNKKVKELLDRQSHWGLSSEELGVATGSGDLEAAFSPGAEQGGSQKSSLQQFYDALNRSGSPRQNADRSADHGVLPAGRRLDPGDDRNSGDDPSLPPGIRDKAKRLKELMNDDPSSIFNPTQARSSFDNFFGLADDDPTRERMGAAKTSMDSFIDQFKKVLDTQSPAPQLNPGLSALVPDNAARRAVTYPASDALLNSTHRELTEATPGNINAVLNQATLPDLNGTVLNQWNPMYAPAKVELPPKPAPPTPINAEFPRRRF